MTTTLELALSSLLASNKPLSVQNAVTAYFEAAGFSDSSHCMRVAALAFEHAMDKYALLPPTVPTAVQMSRRQSYVSEVPRIREEYWALKRGVARCACGRCMSMDLTRKCTCGKCPPQLSSTPEWDSIAHAQDETDSAPESSAPRKRKMKKRRVRRRASSSRDSSPAIVDPYAPSTSAIRL
ncbi:hypothetical protein BDW22DRAFT_1352951 [Trametopsis cervina]|nr:hypothetical protein BDW22DRAFT_1352951 [Trametopsis cervina]